MKILLLIAALLIGALLLIGIPFGKKYFASKKLVQDARPFSLESGNYDVAVLVLGDSTAYGVGASQPEDSVSGRFSVHVHATSVENYAKSGAVVADLNEQVRQAKFQKYAYILIQIGANDIIRFHNAGDEALKLQSVLTSLPTADTVIVLSAGNIGGTTLFPFFVNPLYTKRTLAYHVAFERVVSAAGGKYVNLYEDPKDDQFLQQPEMYFAADGLHPSSEGYRLWFEKVKAVLPAEM